MSRWRHNGFAGGSAARDTYPSVTLPSLSCVFLPLCYPSIMKNLINTMQDNNMITTLISSKFCGNVADRPEALAGNAVLLGINIDKAKAATKYDGVAAEDIIELAAGRLKVARVNFIKVPTDRFSAIAILEGLNCRGCR